MNEKFLYDKKVIRAYLLGQISSNEQLEDIEKRLFTDEHYFQELLFQEDELIEEYVFKKRAFYKDKELVEKFILSSPERFTKVKLIESLIKSSEENNYKSMKLSSKNDWFARIVKEVSSFIKDIKTPKLKTVTSNFKEVQ